MFGNYLKWVEKQSSNFPYLACCEIELFSKKKNSEKQSLNRRYILLIKDFFFLFFTTKHKKTWKTIFTEGFFYQNKQSARCVQLSPIVSWETMKVIHFTNLDGLWSRSSAHSWYLPIWILNILPEGIVAACTQM